MHYTIRYETLYVFFRYVEKEKKNESDKFEFI